MTNTRYRQSLWFIIFSLTLIVIFLIGYAFLSLPGPNRNELITGENAPASVIDVAIQLPAELDFKTRDEIMQMRVEAVNQHAELIDGTYRPAEAVFGQIEDNLPWWGMAGVFYYGSGEKSIEGASEESRFLLNPYLLVGVDLYHNWAHVTEAQILAPGVSLDCAPTQLDWYPIEGRAEVTYSATCVSRTNSRYFDLISYNARDMNLNYIYVSYADSRNISKPNPPTTPYAIPHYIHRGDSCGFPGGCNNMSPPSPEIDGLEITGFPAHVLVWLWKDKPSGISQLPDMVFVIRFS